MPLYQLSDISHHYGGRPVLEIDQWQVAADAVTGIVGPNGSGKSTLLSLLGFVVAPTRGEIRFEGRPAQPFSDTVLGNVALLPQDAFMLKRSVYGNIVYGLKMRSIKQDRHQRVYTAMEMVGLDPDEFSKRPWYALSGGEARRVALAARLALQPRVLLMDEPTTSVDAASAQMIKEAALHARKQWGTILIVTSHDAEWLADISDHIVQLFRGRILGSGHQNLIFGPWEKQGRHQVVRNLSSNQSFIAHGDLVDLDSAVAAVPANQLEIYTGGENVPGQYQRLKGVLLRLNFEHATGRISASVLVGRTIITAYLSAEDQAACTFGPGQTVWIGYDPHSVAWY